MLCNGLPENEEPSWANVAQWLPEMQTLPRVCNRQKEGVREYLLWVSVCRGACQVISLASTCQVSLLALLRRVSPLTCDGYAREIHVLQWAICEIDAAIRWRGPLSHLLHPPGTQRSFQSSEGGDSGHGQTLKDG